MREQHNQHPWLAQVLTDDHPPWKINLGEKICKSIFTFTIKFWRAVVRLWLFPTGGDNVLGEERESLVASLMSGFLLNMEVIRVYEMRAPMTKFSISLPFPCLVIRLCKEAYVPILAEIDLGTFVDRAIVVALAPYEFLHDWIDNMEARVNERLKDLTMPDLAMFDSKVEEPFTDLLGEQPKAAGKRPQEGDENEEISKRKKHKKRKQEQEDLLEAQRLSRV
ncbi:hypothetical protein HAX54_008200 [Datura stramonium]|uniref:Putative plant transposon protein domain-containing protein n=1 Tax=Datura stramonium TaxID=4076 RepID=A0ABS8TCU0_DATST|nr:hypothetical protein [Datura stramonium]